MFRGVVLPRRMSKASGGACFHSLLLVELILHHVPRPDTAPLHASPHERWKNVIMTSSELTPPPHVSSRLLGLHMHQCHRHPGHFVTNILIFTEKLPPRTFNHHHRLQSTAMLGPIDLNLQPSVDHVDSVNPAKAERCNCEKRH